MSTDLSDALDHLPSDQEPAGAVQASNCAWEPHLEYYSPACRNGRGWPRNWTSIAWRHCPWCGNPISINQQEVPV